MVVQQRVWKRVSEGVEHLRKRSARPYRCVTGPESPEWPQDGARAIVPTLSCQIRTTGPDSESTDPFPGVSASAS